MVSSTPLWLWSAEEDAEDNRVVHSGPGRSSTSSPPALTLGSTRLFLLNPIIQPTTIIVSSALVIISFASLPPVCHQSNELFWSRDHETDDPIQAWRTQGKKWPNILETWNMIMVIWRLYPWSWRVYSGLWRLYKLEYQIQLLHRASWVEDWAWGAKEDELGKRKVAHQRFTFFLLDLHHYRLFCPVQFPSCL